MLFFLITILSIYNIEGKPPCFPDPNYKVLTVEDYNEINFPTVTPTIRLFYSDSQDVEDQQFGDLYIPKGKDGPFPVVILIHGGCYTTEFGLERLGLLCEDLQSQGYAVWNLEYRRVGNGGGFPQTFMDIAKGSDFLRTIHRTYNLDISQVVAVGHSAGGHFALWLAARTNLDSSSILYSDNPLSLVGVVNLAGIPDLENTYNYPICGDGALITQLMGGTPQQVPEAFAQGSLKELVPVGPQIVVQGLQDDLVPFDYEKEYVEFERNRGGEIIYFNAFDYSSHFEVILPSVPVGNFVKAAVAHMFTLGSSDVRGQFCNLDHTE